MRAVVHTWEPCLEGVQSVSFDGIREAVASLVALPTSGGCIALAMVDEPVRSRPGPWTALGARILATGEVAGLFPTGTFTETPGATEALRWRLTADLPLPLETLPRTWMAEKAPESVPAVFRSPLLGSVDYAEAFLSVPLAGTKVPRRLVRFLAGAGVATVGDALTSDVGVLDAFTDAKVKEPVASLRKEVEAQHARWLKAVANAPPPEPSTVPTPGTPDEAVAECRRMGLLWSLRAGAVRDATGSNARLLRHLGISFDGTDGGPDAGDGRSPGWDGASETAGLVEAARDLAGWPDLLAGEIRERQDADGRTVIAAIGLNAWWRDMELGKLIALCAVVVPVLFGTEARLVDGGNTVDFSPPKVVPPPPKGPGPTAVPRKFVPASARPVPRVAAPDRPAAQPEPSAVQAPAVEPVASTVLSFPARAATVPCERLGMARAAFLNPLDFQDDESVLAVLARAKSLLADSAPLFVSVPYPTRHAGTSVEDLLGTAGFRIHEEIVWFTRGSVTPSSRSQGPGWIRDAYEAVVARGRKLSISHRRVLVAAKGNVLETQFPEDSKPGDLGTSTNCGGTLWCSFDDGNRMPQGIAKLFLSFAMVNRRQSVVDCRPKGDRGLELACVAMDVESIDGTVVPETGVPLSAAGTS